MLKFNYIAITLFFILVASLAFFTSTNTVYAKQDVSIEMAVGTPNATVNGVQVKIDDDENVGPFIVNNRTMVPIRFIGESLSLVVSWNELNKTATLTSKSSNIKLVVDSEIAVVNGKNIKLDSPAITVNDRLFVPVRFIAENFSCGVYWDSYNERVIIKEEKEIDINAPEVQKIFSDTLNGDAFMCYYDGFTKVELLDGPKNFFGGRMREIISALSIKDGLNKFYSDIDAQNAIKEFLSKGNIEDDMSQFDLGNLKSELEQGGKFGENATQEQYVGTFDKNKFEVYNKKLFGKPLPKMESVAYSVAYGSFFFYSRNNIVNMITAKTPAVWCSLYYNEANEKYLFTKALQSISNYTNEDIEPLKYNTKLLKATKHNDEISLLVHHESEFGEYSGGKSFYKGNYNNTYKIDGDSFYWVSSYGIDEK